MQEHELTAWLGGVTVTSEQTTRLHAAAAAVDTRYSSDMASQRESAFAAAAAVILGDATPEDFGDEWCAARAVEREAMVRLTGAIIAAAQDTSEVQIAARVRVDRMTVRRALAK